MRRSRLLTLLFVITVGLAIGVGAAQADSKPSPPTFVNVIDRAVFVALADVRLSGATTELRIERVFKGDASPLLTFTTSPTDVPLSDGERVVIALRQNSLDPRGGAIAWEVGSDGNLDPSHFQQYPGVPRTIDELLAFFGQAPVPTATHPFALATPSASTPVRSSGDAGPDAAVVGAILAALVLLGAIGVAMLRRRTRDA